MRLAPLLVLAALSTPAAAQEVARTDLSAEADLHFELGSRAAARGDYSAALEHLLLSNRLAPNRNVVYNIAVVYEATGRYDSAYRYYSDYVRMEPNAELRAQGEEALDRIAAEVALVRVGSSPPGATVYVDRRELGARGVTPLTLALEPGEGRVLLEMEGYEPAEVAVTPSLGQEEAVSVELERVLGTLELEGGPAGAEVLLDGEVIGALPGAVSLPPGQQLLTIREEGYREAREVVDVEADAVRRLEVQLELLSGNLVVDAMERGALIEVDGEPEGFTPEVLDLPQGEHVVRISKPGFRPEERVVTVEADTRATLEVRLRSQQEISAASRTSQRAEDAPASVSVITGAELRAFGYETVYEALAGTRGVYYTDDLTYEYLGFRGFARTGDYGNRVLVTMDGHTLNDDQIGASYVGSDLMVDLRDIEQIELVRGPGSALYGTNAFFGVINLVTGEGEDAPGSHVSSGVADDRTARARARVSVGDEERGVWASASGLISQGADFYFEELEADGGDGWVRDADRTMANTLHAKAWLGDLTVQAMHTGRQKRFATGAFETIPGDPRASSDDFRGFAELRYEPKLGERAQLWTRAWVDRYVFRGDYPYEDEGVYEDLWRGTWVGAEPRLRVEPAERLSLTAGAEARLYVQAELEGLAPDGPFLDADPTQQVYAGYAIAEWAPTSWLRTSLGGRYDYLSIIGQGSFNPRAALILQPGEDDVLKLLGGSAFRAPSPYELYYGDGGLTQQRPDSLDPEDILTGELEYTHRFTEVVSLTGAAYFNRIESLVDTEVIELGHDDNEVIRYTNVDEPVQTGGAELELRRDWRRGAMLALQGSFQRTRAGDFLSDRYLTNSPWALFSVKAAAPLPSTGITAASRMRAEAPRLTTGGEWTDWAMVVDLTFTGTLEEYPVDWAVGVRNMLDWEVQMPGGYDLLMDTVPTPGRSAYARLTWNF